MRQPLFGQYADHSERDISDPERLSDSGTPIEQLLDDNRSHKGDLGPGCKLITCKGSATGNLPFACHEIVGIDTRN